MADLAVKDRPYVLDEQDDVLIRRIVDDGTMSLIEREWLVTNALGGYASGTIAGASTRRYHGLLIAAHPAPLGRIMLLSHLNEHFKFPDSSVISIGVMERADRTLELDGVRPMREFRLEMGIPVWQYAIKGHVFE